MQKIFPKIDSVRKSSAPHKPGKFPTFVKQATLIDTAVENSLPDKLKNAAQINIVTSARKKNPRILPAVCNGTGTSPIFIAGIIFGCNILRISVAVILNRIITRTILNPPVTEPIQPPVAAIRKTKNLSKSPTLWFAPSSTKPVVDTNEAI